MATEIMKDVSKSTLDFTPELVLEISKDVSRFRRRLDIILQEEFGDRRNALFLDLKMDGQSYTDHKVVHIGALTIPPKESKDEVIPNLLFLEGHEAQHVLSTNNKWWMWAHKTGVTELCKKFSAKIEGPGARRFVKPQDVDTFIEDMKKKGIKINRQYLERIIHTVVNSCEDGRIERIRSKRDFIFKKLRKATRGREWLYNPMMPFIPAMLGPDDKLKILLNQVLSLATTSLYQKDFLKYADDEMEEKTLGLMGNIRNAVMSKGTETCMKEGLEICYKLADEILEAMQKPTSPSPLSSSSVSSASSSDTDDEMNDDGTPKSTYPNSSRTEEKDSEGEGDEGEAEDTSVFGKSDLDKGGDTEEDAESKAKGKSESDTGKRSDAGSDSGKSEDTDGKGSSTGDKSDEDGPTDGKSERRSEIWEGKRVLSDTDGAELSEDEIEAIKNEILEAMKEAAELANGEIGISDAMDASAAASKPDFKETPNTDKEPDTRSADEAARENGEKVTLIENTRKYELSEEMPANLELEASHFRSQIDELFRNKQKPDIRDRKTGRMDGSRIAKLAMHQIDVYKKVRQSDEFDGVAYFLLDNSGSMGMGYQSKRWYAAYALAIIEEGFKSHVPLKIVAFDASGSNCVQHEVIKGFSEKTNYNCSYNFCVRGRGGWGNKDGYSIRVATSELLSRPEQKKILFILSDGAPTDYIGGCSMGKKDVHDAVAAARAAGIEVCAIYFDFDLSQSSIDYFIDMYERNYVVTEPENVPDEISRLMHGWVM